MPGAEFVAVAVVTSSITAIVDEISKVLNVTLDAQDLPEVFHQAQSKLEVISDILYTTTIVFRTNNASGVERTVQKIIGNCQRTWLKLKEIFDKVVPDDDSPRIERYSKAARTLGKGSKVENLIKALLDDIKLLATLKIIVGGKEEVIQANPRKEKLEEHIAEVKKWEPSLPDRIFTEGGYSIKVSGDNNYVAQGEGAKQFNLRDHAQAFSFESFTGNYYNNVNNNILSEITSLEIIDQACLSFLQCPDVSAVKNQLQETKDGLVFESIEWIFRDEQYTNWKDGDNVSLLLIRGGAGKGKTMLSIGVIDALSSNAVVVYFFCQNGNYELNTIEAIIKGLILCLVSQRGEAARVLRNYWNPKTESLTSTEGTPWRTLWNIFLSMLERCECSKIYVVVDAIDECQDDMNDFLRLLVRTGLGRPSKIKWLLSSRPLDTAHQELLAGPNQALVSLEDKSELVAQGVAAYITRKEAELNSRNYYDTDQVLRQEIKNRLIQKAEGTYMWASLVCRELEDVPGDRALTIIEERPPGLHPFYKRALDQLSSGKLDLMNGCIRLLQIMMLAYRPLTVTELDSIWDPSRRLVSIDRLIDRCSSFVRRQKKTGVIEFIHQSARDYLAGDYGQSIINSGERFGHSEITLACLSYLSQRLRVNLADLPRPDSTCESVDVYRNPLIAGIGYAAAFWAQHFECAELETKAMQNALGEQGELGGFLRTKFLEWLECLSLLGKLPYATEALRKLSNIINFERNPIMSALAQNATSFLSQNYQLIRTWPLQIYSSAIIFSPQAGLVREANLDKIPGWLRRIPQVEEGQSYPIQTVKTFSESITAIAFSPDSKTIAAVTKITIELWDVATGDHLKTIVCGDYVLDCSSTNAVVFSPNGKYIISGLTGTVKVWDVVTGKGRVLLEDSTELIGAIAITSDGKHIACGFGRVIDIHDIVNGRHIAGFIGHIEAVFAIAFSLDGKYVASASDSSVNLWDATTGSLQKSFKVTAHSNGWPVTALVFLNDRSNQIATASYDTINVWDTRTGEHQAKLNGHSSLARVAAFSPDGKLITTGSSHSCAIKIWNITDVEAQQQRSQQNAHLTRVKALRISLDGKMTASSSNSKINLWNPITGNLWKTLARMCTNSLALEFSLDGKLVASGVTYYGTIAIWDSVTGSHKMNLDSDLRTFISVAFSPDNKQIVAGSVSGVAAIWEIATGKLRWKFGGRPSPVTAVIFSPDGNWVASGSDHSTINLWDLRNGNLRKKLVPRDGGGYGSDPVCAITFSQDGGQVAAGYESGKIIIWNAGISGALSFFGMISNSRTIYPTREIRLGILAPINSLKFSEDGQKVVTNRGQVPVRLGREGDQDSCFESFEDLGVRSGWIYYGSMGVIRLPILFDSILCDIRGDIVVIGLEDGRVICLNFNRERLRSMLENSIEAT
ncbi:hypothetical protein TWF718_004603 [Orbilia javanica]|uniref:Mitochondrial division protein 1 n=1 Tax=Orbilia javanica TaxID=47235 RepID=A0AAN8RL57_9PEZI